MMKHFLFKLLILLIFSQSVFAAKVALVIGNGGYDETQNGLKLGYLSNPVNDAQDVAKELENLGFEVILRTDANERTMKNAIYEFGDHLRNFREQTDIGLFYYSGHGFQYNKINYLVPLRVNIQDEVDIEEENLKADYVLRYMKNTNKKGANILILDACRASISKEFLGELRQKKGFKDLVSGLAKMEALPNSLIAYATQPDTDSLGGLEGERNSLYTKHLLKKLQSIPHLNITNVFIEVRDQVMQETENEEMQQVPWESVLLRKNICFGQCGVKNNDETNELQPYINNLVVNLKEVEIELEYQQNIILIKEASIEALNVSRRTIESKKAFWQSIGSSESIEQINKLEIQLTEIQKELKEQDKNIKSAKSTFEMLVTKRDTLEFRILRWRSLFE